MIEEYQKGIKVTLTDDFDSTDFDCHCNRPECVITLIDRELVNGLQSLIWRYPILSINSGTRCLEHNHEVGGVPASYHLQGKAADIRTPFATLRDLAEHVQTLECFRGVGIASSFIHVDCRDGTKAIWTYPNK